MSTLHVYFCARIKHQVFNAKGPVEAGCNETGGESKEN
jgi:hypothetical protein